MDSVERTARLEVGPDLQTPGALQGYEQRGRSVEASFERGKLRLTSFAEGVVRVHFSATGAFAPRRPWAITEQEASFGVPDWTVQEVTGGLVLSANSLNVHLAKDGRLSLEQNGVTFAEDALPPRWREIRAQDTDMRLRKGDELPPGRARLEVRSTKTLPLDEALYGLGERTGKLERRGRVLTNWNFDPDWGHGRHQSNLYQSHPALLAVRPGLAWGMFLASSFYSQFDVGQANWERLESLTLGGELDMYLFCGPTPAEVTEQITRLTGRPFMPPLWALGYHQSRWGYRSDEEMRRLVQNFRGGDIPLDVLHFDIDYMRGYRDFTWHPERFPEPKTLLDDLRDEGVRAVTILDPGVKNDLDGYGAAERGVEREVFIKNGDGSRFVGYCWPGEALFPDYTREEVRAWWGDELKESHIDTGVAGVWVDMNEPSIFDAPFDSEEIPVQKPMPLATPQGGGQGDDEAVMHATTHAEVHNLYGHLMARATFEGLHRHRPDERPWVLTRSAFVGTQRYAASWMGDNSSWWEHLEASLPQLSSMGLVGSPWVGVDIGGFFENANPELYARWIELGTFYPFMRTHTCQGTHAQEPWSFGNEVEEIAQRAIKLRYRLLPYLYTLAHRAHERGEPSFRPLVFDFPNDAHVYQLDDQVMVGPHLLVAPVYRPGQSHRMVYLPAGIWYDFWTGQRVSSGHHTVQAPLGRIPVFVRGGAVLPLGNERASTVEPLDELTLNIYPAGERDWTLLEDDGLSFAYREGEVARLETRVSEADEEVFVEVTPDYGRFEPAPRDLVVAVCLASPPERVTLAGEEVAADWDETRRTTSVRWRDDGRSREIVVSRSASS